LMTSAGACACSSLHTDLNVSPVVTTLSMSTSCGKGWMSVCAGCTMAEREREGQRLVAARV
jgi:hypothetical protein